MSKAALLPKRIPFDADKALAIIADYKLPKNRFYEWKNRGYIPGIYVNESSLLNLVVAGESLTRSLFYWRVRLGLKQKDIAEWCGVTTSAVGLWETGTRSPKSNDTETITKNLQLLIQTAF